MSADNLAIGAVFGERYKVIQRIAAGGMGAVYEVEHLGTERRRALKIIHPHLVASDELRQRFQQEAKVAGQIKSKYVVDVFDTGIDPATGMPFLVMELLRGQDLGQRLKKVGRFAPEEALRYLRQTATALDKTHRANIVHRDLKPDNLFLCEDDEGPPQIKVLDFGIAKFVAEGGTQANATRSLGTPLYMAPEQFRHGAAVTPATDIFSLGMMAYTLLVGVSYWAEENAKDGNIYSFVGLALHGPQEAASARAARRDVELPAAFDDWFRNATAEKPEQRFSSASAAIDALANAFGVNFQGSTTSTGLRFESLQPHLTPPGSLSKSSDIALRTPSGRTPSGQTGSNSRPKGITGNSDSQSPLLRNTSQPSMPSNRFGLSSSKPTSDPGRSGELPVDGIPVNDVEGKRDRQRNKKTAFIVAAGVALCFGGIGFAAISIQKKAKAPTELVVASTSRGEEARQTAHVASVTVTPVGTESAGAPAAVIAPSAAASEDLVFDAPNPSSSAMGTLGIPTSNSPAPPKVNPGPKPSPSAKPTPKTSSTGFGY